MMDLEHNNDVSFNGSIKAIKDELVWIIRSVNPDRIRSIHGIVSPTIFVGCKGLLGTLHLLPNGFTEFLSLTVYLNSTDNNSLPPKFWAYIKCQLLQNKQVLASSTAVGTFSWEQNYYVFQNFVRASDLYNCDRLAVCCFINILDCRINQVEVSSFGFDSRKENIKPFQAEIEFKKEEVVVPTSISTLCTRHNFRKDCKHFNYLEILGVESSDVTLITSDVEFPAHRNILASNSIVFSAMFLRRAEENADNRIIINDVTPDVLHEVLRFIYTKKLGQYELVPGVLIAADKYKLGKLRTLCERILFNKTNPGNVCGILLLADRYDFQSLKNWGLLFIRAFADLVVQTQGFQVLKNSNRADLMAEVVSELALSLDE